MGIVQAKLQKKERKKRLKQSPVIASLASTISSTLKVKFPSSNNDIDFLHQHHFILKSVWSSNYSSPIDHIFKNGGAKILDALCCAGTFLLELSNEHQSAEFFGVDHRNLFPLEIKPKNLTFISADVLNGLPFDDDYFDFVHMNITESIYTVNNWDYIVNELLRVTKPGGSVEIQGFDFVEGYLGPNFKQFAIQYMMLFESTEIDMKPRDTIRSLFSNHFETSHEDVKSVLLGKKGGDLGLLLEQHLTMFFRDTIGEKLAKSMNVDTNEYEKKWDEVLKELAEFDTFEVIYRIRGTKGNNIKDEKIILNTN